AVAGPAEQLCRGAADPGHLRGARARSPRRAGRRPRPAARRDRLAHATRRTAMTGARKEPFKNISEPTEAVPTYRCPCCRHKTLLGPGAFEICPVCWWEDDGQDQHDADEVRGGPNGDLSLRAAQRNFAKYGASH